ncbi:MAG: heme-binding protein [Burkholderiaceae bacterium]
MSTEPAGKNAISVPARTIAADAAHRAVRAAVAHAESLGIRINAAVTDPAGVLVAFLRMPGAFVPSVEIAIDKAFTAAGFGFPTSRWMDVLAGDEALRMGFPHRPRLVLFAGGVPIHEDGVLIGAIGVSGGSAEQDDACARAGLAEIGLD